jgi:hypothetical protein
MVNCNGWGRSCHGHEVRKENHEISVMIADVLIQDLNWVASEYMSKSYQVDTDWETEWYILIATKGTNNGISHISVISSLKTNIIHIFLTLVVAGSEWSASHPDHFTPGEKDPRTHWKRGWVDPRASLDDVEKRKFLTLLGLKLRPLGRPARSQSLYRLSYPSSWFRFSVQRRNGQGKMLFALRYDHKTFINMINIPVLTDYVVSEQQASLTPRLAHNTHSSEKISFIYKQNWHESTQNFTKTPHHVQSTWDYKLKQLRGPSQTIRRTTAT